MVGVIVKLHTFTLICWTLILIQRHKDTRIPTPHDSFYTNLITDQDRFGYAWVCENLIAAVTILFHLCNMQGLINIVITWGIWVIWASTVPFLCVSMIHCSIHVLMFTSMTNNNNNKKPSLTLSIFKNIVAFPTTLLRTVTVKKTTTTTQIHTHTHTHTHPPPPHPHMITHSNRIYMMTYSNRIGTSSLFENVCYTKLISCTRSFDDILWIQLASELACKVLPPHLSDCLAVLFTSQSQ